MSTSGELPVGWNTRNGVYIKETVDYYDLPHKYRLFAMVKTCEAGWQLTPYTPNAPSSYYDTAEAAMIAWELQYG